MRAVQDAEQEYGKRVSALSKYTVVYSKENEGIYISHLDFLRTIGRSLRRAGFPVKYSEGFNPHVCLSFASPLSVGISSGCEMFICELLSDIDEGKFKERLNAALPKSIRAVKVTKGSVDFSEIAYADYEIKTEGNLTAEEIEKFLSMDEIPMDKKTKKGIKETDIKPDIFGISGNNKVYRATLKTGNQGNLKPMLLMDAIRKYASPEVGFCTYKRLCFKDENQKVIGDE